MALFIALSITLVRTVMAYQHQVSLKEYLSKEEPAMIEDLVIGSMGLYLSMDELQDLLDSVMLDYQDEVVFEIKLGNSRE